MNTETLHTTERRPFESLASIEQNVAGSMTQRVTLFVVWAMVSVPMVWGVLKAWEEAQLMF